MLTTNIVRSLQSNLLRRLTVRCHPHAALLTKPLPHSQFRQFSSDKELDDLFGESKEQTHGYEIAPKSKTRKAVKKEVNQFDASDYISKNNNLS